MSTPFAHTPVLRDEVVAWLAPVPAGLVLDATVGGGGHAEALLDAHPGLRLLGLDRDPDAVVAASARLARFGDRATVRRARFDHLAEVVAEVAGDGTGLAGALFDLGVSSVQLDRPERGFSYRVDEPLDMRMDPADERTAADVVNGYTVHDLARVLREYADERFAGRIARAIVAARPITTTGRLAEVVTAAIPAATRRHGGHPATRTFQALRIEVNAELDVLGPALDQAIDLLLPGGRCVVIAYHSGEDRVVKDRFRFAESGGCTCPVGLPCVCGALPRGRTVRRGVTRPSAAEAAANPRASSALARVFEKGTGPGRPGPALPGEVTA